jgi:WD40 repeat protein
MRPSIPLKQLAALPLALMAVVLAGCPDTSVNPQGPVGMVKLVQTLAASDDADTTLDPDATQIRDFVLSFDDEKIYASSFQGAVLTFDRSPLDGSLARSYETPLAYAFGIALTPDGEHLFAEGGASPSDLLVFDVDPVTGEPVPQLPGAFTPGGFELAVADSGALLYHSAGGFTVGSAIRSYQIDPASGALTPGPTTPHDSTISDFVFLVDDEHGSLYAEEVTADGRYIVRYGVDPAGTGALTKQATVSADLWWAYVILDRCPGTTRIYVPQEMGNIGYADSSGTGLTIPSVFVHPDLAHVRSATLSPDCKNLYAVTQETANGSLVVLERDEAGDLTWLQTIPMGMGTAIPAISEPWYARTSADGKNVYVGSWADNEGFAVFQRDTTGAGFQ